MGLRKDSDSCDKSGQENISYKSASETYKQAALVADSKIASDIGNYILSHKQGNAVDAAVAALVATGVVSAHSCGIGGGSFFVIYGSDNSWHAVDCRETAPMAAREDMFVGSENKRKSLFGGMAIAVPGEVKGLYEVHQKFGRVPWRDLIMPTVRLCLDGVPLTSALHIALGRLQTQEQKNQFREYFDHNHNIKPTGTAIRLPKLAKTFQMIADDPLSFYHGRLAKDIAADIHDAGGIITCDDLSSYSVKWTKPSVMNLPGNLSVHSIPPPGSGPVLGYILNILSGYNLSPASIADETSAVLTNHRIVEAMKFAYGKRSELGDEDFVDVSKDVAEMHSLAYGEKTRKKISDTCTHDISYYNPNYYINNDHGTAHVSVIDSSGSAVSVTSTINTYFGCQVRGSRTGIIFNSVMDDFSTPNTTNYFNLPASPSNFIQPGKRPMSSMCPAIVFDNNTGCVRMVTGAAGGSKITTATAMNIIDVLWFGLTLPASIDRPRLHHQLFPAEVQFEGNYPKAILNGLKAKGHVLGHMQGQSIIHSIDVLENGIIATADFRKGGAPSGH